LAFFYLEEQWEADYFRNGFEVVDDQSGEVVAHQQEKVSKGYQIGIIVKLNSHEEKHFSIRAASKASSVTTSSTRLRGADRMYDIQDLIQFKKEEASHLLITENQIESPYVRITWRAGDGIISWIDKQTGKELISNNQAGAAFTPVAIEH
jgi:hypothetical protein